MKRSYKRKVIFLICLPGILIILSFIVQKEILRKHDQSIMTEEAGTAEILLQEALDMENPTRAAELTRAATVRLEAFGNKESWSGTAVIWDQNEGKVILATSAHLLEKAEDKLTVSVKAMGADTEKEIWASTVCDILGICETADVGFVSFPLSALEEEFLSDLRCVRLHQRTYDTISAGDSCFAAGAGSDGAADLKRELTFIQADFAEEGIGENLFLFEGACEPGMSGSGVFDGYGHFIGMVVATDERRTLAVPMEDINAAYRELTGRTRNTRAYE